MSDEKKEFHVCFLVDVTVRVTVEADPETPLEKIIQIAELEVDTGVQNLDVADVTGPLEILTPDGGCVEVDPHSHEIKRSDG